MRKVVLVLVLAITLMASWGVATAQQQTAWVAYLSGAEAVPRTASRGTGMASFEINAARTGIAYYLSVGDIQNVQMAHIHIGAPGIAGPVAVWLYPAAPPPVLLQGAVSGMIGQGTFTAANFTGPLAGQQMSALLNAIAAGNAYVNVHTTANPGGEIRGLVR